MHCFLSIPALLLAPNAALSIRSPDSTSSLDDGNSPQTKPFKYPRRLSKRGNQCRSTSPPRLEVTRPGPPSTLTGCPTGVLPQTHTFNAPTNQQPVGFIDNNLPTNRNLLTAKGVAAAQIPIVGNPTHVSQGLALFKSDHPPPYLELFNEPDYSRAGESPTTHPEEAARALAPIIAL
ncbi:MAG: hypothetical protein MMC23_003765 [Stictis urceolatum]|nr:hypothetical protein [Stictis urceolata]